jgi:hypothetical protein
MPEYSKWIEVSKEPTNYKNENGQNCHESLLRSFGIVREVKRLLSLNTPAEVILEAIKVMEQ